MIEVRDLTKSYDFIEALKGVSFTVEKGEIVGFLGPNGAGKTTTMKIITCYMPQTSGSVMVDGHDINADPLEVRRKIGYLPESNPLYTEMLVYDYLKFVAGVRGVPSSKVHERILAVAGMTGLAPRLGQEIGTLSKGFRQRVGLAQALIHDPEILILDEPTSGLDPNQIVEIRNLIRELGKERTIILSTHNLPEVMATCDRMLIVHRGQLVADGTPAELEAREHESPHISYVVRGAADAATVAEKVRGIEGVESVDEAVTAVPDAVAVEIVAAREPDLRPALYRMAVDNSWELVELHREGLSLEGIFRKLTKEV